MKETGEKGASRRESDFDAWVEIVQAEIWAREEEEFSPRVVQAYRNPTHYGRLQDPDATGTSSGHKGYSVVVDLAVVREGKGTVKICEARFVTDGCGPVAACAEVLCQMVEGTTIGEARAVTIDALDEELGGLPEGHRGGLSLSLNALGNALDKLEGDRQN
ncbi:MAG: hypothetical protein Kow0069_36540 [Promethearchaeota archaeon]